jgi:hypothetical protein
MLCPLNLPHPTKEKPRGREKALLIDEFTRLLQIKVAFLATQAAQYNFRCGIRT